MKEQHAIIEDIKYSTINSIFDQKEKYIIVALTGKVGAGSSTIAGLMRKSLEKMNLSYSQPGLDGLKNDANREQRILQRYYGWHQKEFYIIKVRDVILSFMLEKSEVWTDFVNKVSKYNESYRVLLNNSKKLFITRLKDNCIIQNGNEDSFYKFNTEIFSRKVKRKDESENVHDNAWIKNRHEYIRDYLPNFGEEIHDILSGHYTEIFQYYGNQLRFFGTTLCDKESKDKGIDNKRAYANNHQKQFEKVSEEFHKIQYDDSANSMFTIAKRINQFIKILEYPEDSNHKQPIAIIIDSIKNIYESNYLKDRYTAYYLISASRDENLRKSELRNKRTSESQEQLDFIDFNEQPSFARKNLRKFARIFLTERKKAFNPTRKAEETTETYNKRVEQYKSWEKYFQYISESNEDKLYERLLNTELLENDVDQEFIDTIKDQYIQDDKAPFREEGISNTLYKYYCEIIKDPLRIFLYLTRLYPFYLQDVETCIQNADIFLTNNEETNEKALLCQAIVRYISLMMHPGLVPPTPVERCMQLAYTAKANSGCISRQVGAVVTDSDYKILSLGWNDVPCGQTSCVYRNLIDVSRGVDGGAYSEYEIGKDSEFKKYTQNFRFKRSEVELRLRGLPAGYCFKDMNEELTGEKNPMMARSMHAEEKALLLCNKERAKGGNLFTTSSPCLMCSKNAKEHGIKKIYYIEPYPGISQTHVCNSGDMDNRAQYVLFEGAIGRAYTQLYTPIMPYKDELQVRGVPGAFKRSNILPKGSIQAKDSVYLQGENTRRHKNVSSKMLAKLKKRRGRKRNAKICKKRR